MSELARQHADHMVRRARLFGAPRHSPVVKAPALVAVEPAPVMKFPVLSIVWSGKLDGKVWPLNIDPAPKERPTVRLILTVVAREYCVDLSEMCGDHKGFDVLRPRMVAMYLARKLTTKSNRQISSQVGNRDHTSVINAKKKIGALIEADQDLAARVARLEVQLSR